VKIDLLNAIVTIRLNNGKLIQVNESKSSVTISTSGALLIEFPNGNRSIYAPNSWEKITTTNREMDGSVSNLFRSEKTKRKKSTRDSVTSGC